MLQVFEDGGAVVEVTLQVAQKRTDAFVPLGVLTGPFMPTVLDHSILTQCQGIVTPGQDSSSDLFLAEVATHRYRWLHWYLSTENVFDFLTVL